MSIELPPLPGTALIFPNGKPERVMGADMVERAVEARERILQARIAEQDQVIAIARDNAVLLTSYWKQATDENRLLRSILKENGVSLADYDLEDGEPD